MCVPEVCSHEIVSVKGSVAPVAAGDKITIKNSVIARNSPHSVNYRREVGSFEPRWLCIHRQI